MAKKVTRVGPVDRQRSPPHEQIPASTPGCKTHLVTQMTAPQLQKLNLACSEGKELLAEMYYFSLLEVVDPTAGAAFKQDCLWALMDIC